MKREKYFEKMRETSEVVDEVIVESLDYLKKLNFDLYSLILEIPAFRKRIGKKEKFRPFLLRLAYEVAGGKDWKSVTKACAAVEILNISTYIDNALFDNKNEIKAKEVTNYVIAARILRNRASYLLRELGNKNYERIEACLNEIDHDVYVAQYQDSNQIVKGVNFRTFKHFLEEYTKRCEYLTGRFIENVARIGAILADAPQDKVETIGSYGRSIGIIIQIMNDLGDFVPVESENFDVEKSYQDQFSDIRMGKLTLPSYYTLTYGDAGESECLKRALGNSDASPELLNDVVRAIMNCGAADFCKLLGKSYSKKAKECLSLFEDSEAKDFLSLMSQMHRTNKYLASLRALEDLHKADPSLPIVQELKTEIRKNVVSIESGGREYNDK